MDPSAPDAHIFGENGKKGEQKGTKTWSLFVPVFAGAEMPCPAHIPSPDGYRDRISMQF
jgi:hypothetical protein